MREIKDPQSFLREDPSLARKVSREEYGSTKSGVDDSGLKEAYNAYKQAAGCKVYQDTMEHVKEMERE